jgi:galactose mutarotase-like enzyme
MDAPGGPGPDPERDAGAGGPARLELPSRTVEISFDAAIDIVTVFTEPGFVCVEPWTSWPDAAAWAARGAATGLIDFDAGGAVSRWMRWSW